MLDYKKEYRKYKIAKFFNKNIDKEFEQLYLWVKDNMIGLKCYQNEDYPNNDYFGKTKNIILIEFQKNDGVVWLHGALRRKLQKLIYEKEINIRYHFETNILKQILEYHYEKTGIYIAIGNPLVVDVDGVNHLKINKTKKIKL